MRSRWIGAVAAGLVLLASSGCGGDDGAAGGSGGGSVAADDADDKLTPEERVFVDAGRPFAQALAARDWPKAHALLAPAARKRMSVNQFAPAEDDAAFARHEQEPRLNVTADELARLMGQAEARYGRPKTVHGLHVHETEAAVLAGTATGKTAAFERMLAIGNMPADVHPTARKASLRGQIDTELSTEQLAAAAKHHRMSPEQLAQDPEFRPYLTLKLVLVDDGGTLRVGYFELLPPSMLD